MHISAGLETQRARREFKPRVFNSILIVVNHGKVMVEAYHKGYNQRGSLDNNICNTSLQILLSSFTIGLFVAFEMCCVLLRIQILFNYAVYTRQLKSSTI